ncbi:MAG: hypothetical protein LBG60_13705 [Bifidobacteriaceae bacterium]|nr:hypothetical protein [Bifidobacteriaceae bacterium]
MTQPYDPAGDGQPQYQVPQYGQQPQYQTGQQPAYDPQAYGAQSYDVQAYGQQPAYPTAAPPVKGSLTRTTNIWIALVKVVAWIIFGALALGGLISGIMAMMAGGPGIIVGFLMIIGGVILGFMAVAWVMIVLNWAQDTAAIRAKLYSDR